MKHGGHSSPGQRFRRDARKELVRSERPGSIRAEVRRVREGDRSRMSARSAQMPELPSASADRMAEAGERSDRDGTITPQMRRYTLDCDACGREIEFEPGNLPGKCPFCSAALFPEALRTELEQKLIRGQDGQCFLGPEEWDLVRDAAGALSERKPEKDLSPAVKSKPSSSSLQEALLELLEVAERANTPEQWIEELERNESWAPLMDQLQKVFRLEGRVAAYHLFAEAAACVDGRDRHSFLLVIELLMSLKPEGGMQSMLAVQMFSVHQSAMRAMSAAMNPHIGPEASERHFNRATRAMRTYAQQAEMFAKLQGRIAQQRITVERLDVNAGGQALVGSVRGEG